MTQIRRLGPVPALDGLRGVAIVIVVAFHTAAVAFTVDMTGISLLDGAIRGGFLGVDLFFVLSGFLITALLLREQSDRGRVSLGSFYLRRALRLLPALFLLLTVHAIYAAVTHPTATEGGGSEFTMIRSALLYVSNWQVTWHPLSVPRGLGHLWSLAIEEQFYLVWPVILIFLLGLQRRVSIVVTAIVSAIVLISLRRAMLWHQGTDWPLIFYRTDARAGGLLIGALLACLWVRGLTPERGITAAAWVASGVFVICLELARGSSDWLFVGGFDVFCLACAALILAAVDGRWAGNRFLELAPLRLLGRVSYGLYLWQVAIFSAVARYGTTWNQFSRVSVAYVLIAVMTTFSWFVVERPALAWKHRLDAKRVAREPTAAPS